MTYPDPSFAHLLALSDEHGLCEHARGPLPAWEHGYCTDDVARGLVVVLREPGLARPLRRLERVYLGFLVRAQLPDGRFHNRVSQGPERRFLDTVGSDDANGRAVWALGVAARRATSVKRRALALECFERGTGFRSPSPRANAAAVLGAVEVLAVDPGNAAARALLGEARHRLGHLSAGPGWIWPESRLAYDNARLPEAMIAAGVALDDRALLDEGLAALGWLVEVETRGDHLSPVPASGWAPGEPRPAFDQQPIEAGAIADACRRAFEATGAACWADACLRAGAWFLGANDVGVSLFDPVSGGCCDGLERDGRNENQGAESTLALISALQDVRAVQAARSAARTGAISTVAAPT